MNVTLTFDVSPRLEKLWRDTITQESLIMSVLADFTVKLDAIDAGVTAINAEIADLKAQLAAGGLSAAEEDVLLAKIVALDAKVNPPAPPV